MTKITLNGQLTSILFEIASKGERYEHTRLEAGFPLEATTNFATAQIPFFAINALTLTTVLGDNISLHWSPMPHHHTEPLTLWEHSLHPNDLKKLFSCPNLSITLDKTHTIDTFNRVLFHQDDEFITSLDFCKHHDAPDHQHKHTTSMTYTRHSHSV